MDGSDEEWEIAGSKLIASPVTHARRIKPLVKWSCLVLTRLNS